MRTSSPHPLLEWPLSELIEVQGLTKYFGARPAIIDLTFSVPHGQVLGFLGPHGAGKSTTMRVGLAQAVLHDPQVLILDEPTAGLDKDQVDEARQLVSVLCEGRTVDLSASSLSEVVGTCERALVIKEGKLVADD